MINLQNFNNNHIETISVCSKICNRYIENMKAVISLLKKFKKKV